jgi:hypothetical protein
MPKLNDDDKDRCRCTLFHTYPFHEGNHRCGARRDTEVSNLYCTECEMTHGKRSRQEAKKVGTAANRQATGA